MASLNNLLNPESSYESSLRFQAVRSPSSTTTSPTEKTSESSSTAVELRPPPRAEVVIRAHEPHPDCPDTLACLPDTDGRPQHTLPVILRCTILGSPRKRLTIREIYAAMERKYPYYKTAGPAWKQSVRHHLSLNRLFERQPRPPSDPGFGSYWTVNLDAPPGTKRPRKRGGRSNKTDSSEPGLIQGLGPVSPTTIIPVHVQPPPLPALPGPPAPQPPPSATLSNASTMLLSSPNAASTSSGTASNLVRSAPSQLVQPPLSEDHLQMHHSPPHSPPQHVLQLQPPLHPHQHLAHAQSPHTQPQPPPHSHMLPPSHTHTQAHAHSVLPPHPHALSPSHPHSQPPPPYTQAHQHSQSPAHLHPHPQPPSQSHVHPHHPHQHSHSHQNTSTNSHSPSVPTIAKLRPVDSRSFSQTSTMRSRRLYDDDDDEEMDWEDGDGPQYSDDDYSSSEDMPYQYDPRIHNNRSSNSYSGSSHRSYSGSQGQPGRSVLHGAFSSYSTIDHPDSTIERLKMEMTGLRRQAQDAVNASLRLSDQLNASQEEAARAKAALKVAENMLEDEARRRIQAEKNAEEEARRRRAAEEALRQYDAQARAQRKPAGYPRS